MKAKITLILLIFFSISFQVFAQQKIYVCTQPGNIFTFDLPSCSSQLLGPCGTQFVDIAVTPNGRLWGIGPWSGDNLYSIDTLTGAASFVGPMGFSGNTLVELNDSILLMAGGTYLYKVNINTAVGTFIGVTGYNPSGDLTWYDNDLYMVTASTGLIVKIVLNNTATAIVSATATSVNPILLLAGAWGAITSPFPSEINAIVAFKSRSVYKICPMDTVPQLLCDTIMPQTEIFYGAAAHRLLTQDPLPTLCSTVTTINESVSSGDFKIAPNPALNKVELRTIGHEIEEIMIYDLIGKAVFQLQINNPKSQIDIDVSKLNAGIYFLQIQTSDLIQSKKLVIER